MRLYHFEQSHSEQPKSYRWARSCGHLPPNDVGGSNDARHDAGSHFPARLPARLIVSEVRDLEKEIRAGQVKAEVLADIAEVLRRESRPLPDSEQARQFERHDAVRQLTGGLAHNLNNILMVILSGAETLCDDLGPQHSMHGVARRTIAATERAAGLMRRLMIYANCSHSAFGRVEIDPTIRAIGQDLQAGDAGRYNLDLDLAVPGVAVHINQQLFSEAVRELVSNAQAAMPQGGAIRLSTTLDNARRDLRKRAVVVAVTDHGVGMDQETRRRACEPFFTTREPGHGVGLGLSLAEGAAHLAVGVLNIHSRRGLGTSVEFHLPVVD
jgi:signal transduction histidine kinase